MSYKRPLRARKSALPFTERRHMPLLFKHLSGSDDGRAGKA